MDVEEGGEEARIAAGNAGRRLRERTHGRFSVVLVSLEGHSKNRGAGARKKNSPRLPLSSAIARRDIRERGTVTHSSTRITNVVKR